jgi:hypothetical protein
MPQFRKRPVVVEAWQYTGDGLIPEIPPTKQREVDHPEDGKRLLIETLEGTMAARPGDWVIRGTAGEYYPCASEIFSEIYDLIDAPSITAEPSPYSVSLFAPYEVDRHDNDDEPGEGE